LPSGRFRARYRDSDGKQHSQSFERLRDARAWRSQQTAAVAAGRHVAPSTATTVSEYARSWAVIQPHGPATRLRTQRTLSHVDRSPLGAMRLTAVRPSHVQAWVTDRSRHVAGSTLRTEVTALRAMFTAAVHDRVIAASPAARLSLPPAERPRVVPLTVPQVAAWADAVPDRCRAMVTTQAGLGLRLGELLGLRVTDVDFLHRVVRVEGQENAVTRTRTDTKTPRSRRTLPLPQVVAEALASHIAAHPPGADGRLFPLRAPNYTANVLRPAAGRAGLPAGTTSHDLRHHYASVLLAAGESVVAVAERLGHTSAALVLRTYGHLMPGQEDRTRRAVDAAWAGVVSDAGSAAQGL
jgi:integrase